jgi:soluble lytic murein transglycosylase-like protein
MLMSCAVLGAPQALAELNGGAAYEIVAQAIAYEHGEGVPKDQIRAAALYCDAARGGDAEAQFRLGWMYANGRGMSRDDAIAASLFALAGAKGHTHAQRMLRFVGDARERLPDCMRKPEPKLVALQADESIDPFANLPAHKQRIADLVRAIAPKYEVSPTLALAIIAVESNFEPSARSPKDARGLMQLIPQTAARFKVRNAFEPTENIHGGLAYLRWLLAYYRGQVLLAAAAYNAGEQAVDRHRGVPPYAETRGYVRRVLSMFRKYDHPYDPTVTAPSPLLADVGNP